MMFHGPPELYDYCSAHSTSVSDELKALDRKTNVEIPMPVMLSGHIQGKFLEMICKLAQAKHILEIGTYTGYSAICMANGLAENGHIHSIDNNPYLEDIQQEYRVKCGKEDQITYHTGDARVVIPQLDITFDLAFIDADKINYSNYYDLILPKLRPGGIIIADNVLYAHEVVQHEKASKNGQALHAFNEKVQHDAHVENLLLPLLDGLMLIRKK